MKSYPYPKNEFTAIVLYRPSKFTIIGGGGLNKLSMSF